MRIILLALTAAYLFAACSTKNPEMPQDNASAPSRSEEPAAAADEPQPTGGSAEMPGMAQPAEKPVGNLPFIGRRTFETRPAVTGTGTPHRYVDILPNGDVFFGYGQQSLSASASGDRVLAGKYGRGVLKCEFSALQDTRYYIVGKTMIVEVDESGHKLSSADCCPNEKVDMETECPCEGALFEPAPPAGS